jgi:type II secretory pathway component PulF
MTGTDRYFRQRLFEYLAWGADVGIPLDEAMRAAAGEPLFSDGAGSANDASIDSPHYRFLAFLRETIVWHVPCRLRVARAAQEVADGAPLSDALARHLAGQLPRNAVSLIRHGETTGALPQALELLRQQVAAQALCRARLGKDLWLALAYVGACLSFIGMLTVLAFPRMASMTSEMSLKGGVDAPRWGGEWQVDFSAAFTASSLVLRHLGWVIVGLLVIVLLVNLVTGSSVLRRWGVSLLARLPLSSRVVRSWWLHEVSATMQVAIAARQTLPEAAAAAQALASHPQLSLKLARFGDAIQQGQPWPAAWHALRLGDPIDDWLIASGAACDDPATALATVAGRSLDRLQRWAKLANTFMLPLITFGQALVVGWFTLAIFSILLLITTSAMVD